MDWTQPIPVNFSSQPTALETLTVFIGHYDCRIYLTDRAWIDVGAGSFGAFARIANMPSDHVGSIGSVGRYCEINETAVIYAGGDHNHDQPVNMSLNTLAMLRPGSSTGGLCKTTGVAIGNGVVISAGARVRPGVRIGDGAVIGANTLVAKDVDPYTIVGGVPARPLKVRSRAQPWWDFDAAYIVSNLERIQALAATNGSHLWRKPRPPFVVRWRPTGLEILGFLDGDRVRPIEEAPEPVRVYIAQAVTPAQSRYWLADCWPD